MDVLTMFVVPAIVGVVIGIMSGLLGIGGGTVMVPIFRLAFGMSPVMSTATSLFAIIPTSISGAASHIKHKTCIPSLGVAAGVGGALTSPLGVWLAQISPAWMIMVAAALIIGWSAVKMLSKAFKLRSQKRAEQHKEPRNAIQVDAAALERAGDAAANDDALDDPAALPATAAVGDPAPRKLTRRQLLIGAAIGLGAGVASGYVGVGGGFIMVPLMLSLIGIEMRQASGTSLIAVMILAIPGVIEQALLGNINYTAGIAIVVGSIPGAVIGARLVRVVPELALRFAFGGFLIVAAVILVLNEFGILG